MSINMLKIDAHREKQIEHVFINVYVRIIYRHIQIITTLAKPIMYSRGKAKAVQSANYLQWG